MSRPLAIAAFVLGELLVVGTMVTALATTVPNAQGPIALPDAGDTEHATCPGPPVCTPEEYSPSEEEESPEEESPEEEEESPPPEEEEEEPPPPEEEEEPAPEEEEEPAPEEQEDSPAPQDEPGDTEPEESPTGTEPAPTAEATVEPTSEPTETTEPDEDVEVAEEVTERPERPYPLAAPPPPEPLGAGQVSAGMRLLAVSTLLVSIAALAAAGRGGIRSGPREARG